MGVSGSGKSTLAKAISESNSLEFIEGDEYHPDLNILKMSQGVPLNDQDRWPWLQALKHEMEKGEQDKVLACSALKQSYRDFLVSPNYRIKTIFLKASEKELRHRMSNRAHFMPVDLLRDQLQTLEEPETGLIIHTDGKTSSKVIAQIQKELWN